jgi:radical SAM superfamily enzyme YgiQ (UPF0313 family)
MHVLFLEIDTEDSWATASVGPAFLAAYLRQHGHDASLLRVAWDMPMPELIEQVRARRPGLLGLSLATRQWLRARSVVRQLREAIDVPVIAGGLHPTFLPECVLDEPAVDFVCLGEGEQALLELVEQLHDGRGAAIRNIWRRGHRRPELRPPFSPPDALPFAARDMLDERHGVVHMVTQRGCPFPCTYCAAAQLNRLYGGTSAYGRRRSVENVMQELSRIRQRGQLNYVIYVDDTFTIRPRWVHEFCRVYADQFHIPFSLHARPDTVDRHMVDALAAAGCAHIVYGVESGSFRVRREIMHRAISNTQMIEVFRITREAGILATANYMLGLPGETREDLEKTVELHAELRPDDFGYFVFYPYPGTPLFHTCMQKGYLPHDYLELPANHRQSILRLPDLSAEEIARYYDRFTQLRQHTEAQRLGDRLTGRDRALVVAAEQQCAARC